MLTIQILRSIQYGIQGSVVALAMKYMLDAVTVNDMHTVYTCIGVISVFFLAGDLFAYFFRNISSKYSRSLEADILQTYMGKYIT